MDAPKCNRRRNAPNWSCNKHRSVNLLGASIMAKHNVISIDLAKTIFQVCGMNKQHKMVFNKPLSRTKLPQFMAQQAPTEVVMEACYSSHFWARRFESMGHTVKLLPAQHVTPFVRGNKSDRNDAVAIAEASRRPNISTVPIKSIEQQDIQSLHRIRERYIAHRTGLMNQTRGLLAEYGIVVPQGHKAFCLLLREVSQPSCQDISSMIKIQIASVTDEYYLQCDRIEEISSTLKEIANAVWLGLTPKQSSSGTTFKSGGITKRGNRYLRKQLVHGARAAVSRCRNKNDSISLWANQLIARRGAAKTYVAMAARMARLAWVLMNKKEMYQAH